jgi:hypothetical protein
MVPCSYPLGMIQFLVLNLILDILCSNLFFVDFMTEPTHYQIKKSLNS